MVDLKKALQADWEQLKKGRSIFNDHSEDIGILDAIDRLIGFNENALKHGWFDILIELLKIQQDDDGEMEFQITMLEYARYGDAEGPKTTQRRVAAGGTLKNFWLQVVEQLEILTNEEKKKEKEKKTLHAKYFHVAKFTILSVKLHMEPSANYNKFHEEFFLRMQMVDERGAFAKHLVKKKILDEGSWDLLQKSLQGVPTMKMISKMATRFKAGYEGSYISRSEWYFDKIDNKNHNMIWKHLYMLGFAASTDRCGTPGGCKSQKCKQARATLLDACEHYKKAFRSTKKIEELKDDPEKFRQVQKAIIWAEFFSIDVAHKWIKDNNSEAGEGYKAWEAEARRNRLNAFIKSLIDVGVLALNYPSSSSY